MTADYVGRLSVQGDAPLIAAEFANPEVLPTSSPLAALLDRFTQSVTRPEAHTIGDFAGTVQALHSELAFLAGHFKGAPGTAVDEISYDEQWDAAGPVDEDFSGILAEEELHYRCLMLSSQNAPA